MQDGCSERTGLAGGQAVAPGREEAAVVSHEPWGTTQKCGLTRLQEPEVEQGHEQRGECSRGQRGRLVVDGLNQEVSGRTQEPGLPPQKEEAWPLS